MRQIFDGMASVRRTEQPIACRAAVKQNRHTPCLINFPGGRAEYVRNNALPISTASYLEHYEPSGQSPNDHPVRPIPERARGASLRCERGLPQNHQQCGVWPCFLLSFVCQTTQQPGVWSCSSRFL